MWPGPVPIGWRSDTFVVGRPVPALHCNLDGRLQCTPRRRPSPMGQYAAALRVGVRVYGVRHAPSMRRACAYPHSVVRGMAVCRPLLSMMSACSVANNSGLHSCRQRSNLCGGLCVRAAGGGGVGGGGCPARLQQLHTDLSAGGPAAACGSVCMPGPHDDGAAHTSSNLEPPGSKVDHHSDCPEVSWGNQDACQPGMP